MTKQYMGAAATAPQTVSTTTAANTSWQARTQAIGSLRAVRGADLAAQASGVVDQIRFESGSDVAAGTVLLKLRANDDPAKLEQLQAAAELAEQTYKRDQEQFAAQAISQAVLDTMCRRSSPRKRKSRPSGNSSTRRSSRRRSPANSAFARSTKASI